MEARSTPGPVARLRLKIAAASVVGIAGVGSVAIAVFEALSPLLFILGITIFAVGAAFVIALPTTAAYRARMDAQGEDFSWLPLPTVTVVAGLAAFFGLLIIAIVGSTAAWVGVLDSEFSADLGAAVRATLVIMLMVLALAVGITPVRHSLLTLGRPIMGLAIALSGFAVGTLVAGNHLEVAFYEVSAQIIPVLLLALSIEGRAFHVRQPGPNRATALIVLTVMIAGEAAALQVLGGAGPANMTPLIVVAALWVGFFSLVVLALSGFEDTQNSMDS